VLLLTELQQQTEQPETARHSDRLQPGVAVQEYYSHRERLLAALSPQQVEQPPVAM
jgi:hypothetical protein